MLGDTWVTPKQTAEEESQQEAGIRRKNPTLHAEQQTEPITLTAQTSCASQVELGWTECNLQQKIREFEKRQGEGEVFNKVFV